MILRRCCLRQNFSSFASLGAIKEGRFFLSTEGNDKEPDEGKDDELQMAVLESQMEPEIKEVPYKSNFPHGSPILEGERDPNSVIERNSKINNLISESKQKKTRLASKPEEQPAPSEEIPVDPDVGFAELGGYSAEAVTGLLDEIPMNLHPVKRFVPGQTYEPEELQPFRLSGDQRFVRKKRALLREHPPSVVREKVDFKNLIFLNNYLSDAGLILSRRETKLSKQLQTKLERSVKTAQALSLLPVLDRRPEFKRVSRRLAQRDLVV